jgi:hypothetical protein
LPIKLESWFLKETIRLKRAKIKNILFNFSKKQKRQQSERKNEVADNRKQFENNKSAKNNDEGENSSEKDSIDGDNHLKHAFANSYLKKRF